MNILWKIVLNLTFILAYREYYYWMFYSVFPIRLSQNFNINFIKHCSVHIYRQRLAYFTTMEAARRTFFFFILQLHNLLHVQHFRDVVVNHVRTFNKALMARDDKATIHFATILHILVHIKAQDSGKTSNPKADEKWNAFRQMFADHKELTVT
jgi:hypothetical protein